MSRPRVARTQSNESVSTPQNAEGETRRREDGRAWRVRAGALSLVAIAIAIPVAAGAAAQPPEKATTEAATKISVHTPASQRRVRKPVVNLRAKAKPAVPVTTAAPKPVVTAPPPTAPPTTQYIPPTTQYVPPTTRYIPPTTQYVPPTTRYVAPTTRYVPPATAAPQQGSGRCGGNLPPCYVMMRESRGSLTAHNPTSTASGKWQFLNSTWQGYGGYATAASAPESVQDARAAQVWAGGSGCSNWSACG